jgi:transposase InsO family protein
MPVKRFCEMAGMPRSVYYAWKKRGLKGNMAKFMRPGRKKGFSSLGLFITESVIEDIRIHPGMDNYALGIRAGVSESTARRIRLKYFKKRKKRKFRSKTKKRVTWGSLHVCWSMDTKFVRVEEGMAYLQMIMEEKSREILAQRVYPEISGELTADLIRNTIHAIDIAPLVIKFDRGGEFKNETVLGLLKENRVIPLISPRHYPQFNGKYEWVNGYIDKHLKHKGVMPFFETRKEIENETGFLNQKKPRRIFNGLTSDDMYRRGRIITENERVIFERRVKSALYRMKKKKQKRMDDMDMLRECLQQPLINMGLLYLNNRLPDYCQQELNVQDIMDKKNLKIRIAKGYDKYSPRAKFWVRGATV